MNIYLTFRIYFRIIIFLCTYVYICTVCIVYTWLCPGYCLMFFFQLIQPEILAYLVLSIIVIHFIISVETNSVRNSYMEFSQSTNDQKGQRFGLCGRYVNSRIDVCSSKSRERLTRRHVSGIFIVICRYFYPRLFIYLATRRKIR